MSLQRLAELKERTDEISREMWELYVRGFTQQKIADQYGMTQQAVSDRLRVYRVSIPDEELDQKRRQHLDQAAAWAHGLLLLAEKEGAPVTSGKDGLVVVDPETGEIVRDYSLRIQAGREARAWQEREAKLLGLDKPTKVAVSGTVEVVDSVDAEIRRLSEELELGVAPERTEAETP